jgi:hypothetical protein
VSGTKFWGWIKLVTVACGKFGYVRDFLLHRKTLSKLGSNGLKFSCCPQKFILGYFTMELTVILTLC